MKNSSKIATIFMVLTFTVNSLIPSLSFAQTASGSDSLELITGDLEIIPVRGLTRVSVTDPDVADVANAESDKIMVLGKKPGQAIVFLWDDEGKRSVTVHVASQDMSTTRNRIINILEKSQIKGVSVEENRDEGKVIVSGSLSKQDKESLGKVLESYNDQMINLVKEKVEEELVQIDMQIVELSTSSERNLGIAWGNTLEGADAPGLQLKYPEALPTNNGKVEDFFKIGTFGRTSPLVAKVNALVLEGKGRILSKPRLVAKSGKEASFLVGGEIPVRSTTSSTTGSTITENTTFKQYGVKLTVTPTIREGKIDVLLNVQVSDIDAAKSTFRDIAYLTRTAQTDLFLEDGQTIVLAGLIKHNDGEELRKVPFLGSIPVVGMLFRSKKTPAANTDTEMVIILTPTIMKSKKFAKEETVFPTPALRQFTKDVEAPLEKRALSYPKDSNASEITPTVVQPRMPIYVAPVVIHDQAPSLVPYSALIQQKISKTISYPYEAMQNNWQGTVKLKLHILKDGTLATVGVLESSGHDVFDQDAVNTAKIAAPYPAFGADMGAQEDLIVTVPIVYSQGVLSKSSGANTTATN